MIDLAMRWERVISSEKTTDLFELGVTPPMTGQVREDYLQRQTTLWLYGKITYRSIFPRSRNRVREAVRARNGRHAALPDRSLQLKARTRCAATRRDLTRSPPFSDFQSSPPPGCSPVETCANPALYLLTFSCMPHAGQIGAGLDSSALSRNARRFIVETRRGEAECQQRSRL
jgi:hypothetical protein